MLLTVSTLAFVSCQGCQPVPLSSQHAPENRYEISSSEEGYVAPLIDRSASIAVVQRQTEPRGNLSIAPVFGSGGLNVDFASAGNLSSLRYSGAPAVVDFESRREAANILRPARNVRNFDAAFALSANDAQTGLGFDVGVVPRISVRHDGAFKQRSFGGEIRIGQNFDQRGENVVAESWYLFAGADGEALVYEPDRERDFTERMALRDQVTVGDMQAGISFSRGGGQLSLSYIRREVEFKERGIRGDETEDFAGVSFTLRR